MRTRQVLSALVALLVAAVLVLVVGGQAVAADSPDLEPFLAQSPATAAPGQVLDDQTVVQASSLPVRVVVSLAGMPRTSALPQNQPYRFAVALPAPLQQEAVAIARPSGQNIAFVSYVWDATAVFEVPAGTPCGSYPTRVTNATDAGLGVFADGVITVAGCPQLTLTPNPVAKAALPATVTGSATGFGRSRDVDVLLDGVDVGDGRTEPAGRVTVTFTAPPSLRCGGHPVTVRQRPVQVVGAAATPAVEASAVLAVVCAPVLEVRPEVVETGFTAVVTGRELPPGPLTLVWDVDGAPRPAARTPVTVAPDGTLLTSVLVLRGEPVGPRRLTATDGASFTVADTQQTLVVLGPFQPGRRSPAGGVSLIGRR